MDYKKIYDALIQKRKKNPAIKTGPGTVERHHILPKSMGGLDDQENLVSLTPREHFVAHHLLWKIYRNDKMTFAFFMMKNTRLKQRMNSRLYWHLRKEVSILQTGRKQDIETIEKRRQKIIGRKHSDEAKRKMSESSMGKAGTFLGKHHSLETKIKMSENSKWRGKHLPKEMVEKMRKTQMLTSPRNMPVLQYDINGNFIQEYFSANEANRQVLNKYGKKINVTSCIKRNGLGAGFIWFYKYEADISLKINVQKQGRKFIPLQKRISDV